MTLPLLLAALGVAVQKNADMVSGTNRLPSLQGLKWKYLLLSSSHSHKVLSLGIWAYLGFKNVIIIII